MAAAMAKIERIETDPASDSFAFRSWPFFGIVQLTGRYHLRLDAVLKPIGMDVARWRALMIISSRGSATITEIADDAVTKMSTMAKIVQRMVAQGLVETRPSEEDARATIVTITDAGRAVLTQIRLKVARVSEQAFRGVSKRELETLGLIVGKIHDNLLP